MVFVEKQGHLGFKTSGIETWFVFKGSNGWSCMCSIFWLELLRAEWLVRRVEDKFSTAGMELKNVSICFDTSQCHGNRTVSGCY